MTQPQPGPTLWRRLVNGVLGLDESEEGEDEAPSSGRKALRDIAKSTLKRIDKGNYEFEGVTYYLRDKVKFTNANTGFHSPTGELAGWESAPGPSSPLSLSHVLDISVIQVSTLDGARHLHQSLASNPTLQDKRIGILNFASATRPGGGFIRGSQAQEESIARSSTLYPSLLTKVARPFYHIHRHNPNIGYFSHAMIYSPQVVLMRADNGDWLPPIEVDVLTSCAAHAGMVRWYLHRLRRGDGGRLEATMKERMARILYAFEMRGIRNLVLGSFGTGVYQNDVATVASIWAELLASDGARFKHSFDRVVFAILGKSTMEMYQAVFESTKPPEPVAPPIDVVVDPEEVGDQPET